MIWERGVDSRKPRNIIATEDTTASAGTACPTPRQSVVKQLLESAAFGMGNVKRITAIAFRVIAYVLREVC